MKPQNLLSTNNNVNSSFISVDWLNFQAVSREKEGKLEEAVSFYLEAIDVDLNQPDWVYGNVITLLGKIKHFQESIEIEKIALSIYPQSSEIYRSLGENSLANEDLKQSVVYLEKALELDSNQPDWVYITLAKNLLQNQNFQSCVDLAEQGIELHPDCYSLHKILDQVKEHNLQETALISKSENKVALELKTDSQSQTENLPEENKSTQSIPDLIKHGDTLFDNQNYELALIEYQQGLEIEQDNYHCLLRTGDCFFRLGDYNQAESKLLYLLQIYPQSYWALVCLGEVYFQKAKFSLAIKYLEEALAIDKDNIWPIILLGKSYNSLGDREKAILYFQQAIANKPEQDISYISLAEIYNSLNKISEAQTNWLKALQINPQNKWATISLGYSYLKQKKITIAEDFFVSKNDLFVDDFDFIFAFAHVYINKMEWQKAEQIMTQASLLNPDNFEVKVRLLELCLYSGELNQAYEHYLSLKDNEDALPKSFYQAAAKLFSEQKKWQLAFKYAKKSIIIESSNIHNHKLFIKTVRKSKNFQEALDFLSDPNIINQENKGAITYLTIAIQEQLLQSIAKTKSMLLDNRNELGDNKQKNRLLRKRLSIKKNIFNTSSVIKSTLNTEIFYCTDLGYSLPTLVSIYSLYKHNKHQLIDKTIYVVADLTTIDVISKTYNELAKKLDIKIDLIDIGSLVQGSIDNQLNTSYGVFTGGDSLSSTAYYRLFFSQFLTRYSSSSRWLYIDSDTLILNSIKQIDELNLLGLPIAARQEQPKPEVEKTIQQNNLKYGKYFNSGVIAFDAQHPELSKLATKAVEVAINEGHRLLYHDQCALNIAFDGQIANLGTQFNDYYPPSDTRNLEELSLSSDSVILHLLDRPKPWDTLSYHKGSIVWFKMLEELSTLIPSNYILELFQLLQSSI